LLDRVWGDHVFIEERTVDVHVKRCARRWARRALWWKPCEVPATGSPRGEAADRSRRLLRARDQQLIESEARLQAFLAAIQASPNGVAILDRQGYIEWFNQTAAKDFGLDPQRDLGQQIGNLVRDPVFAGYYAGRDYGHEVLLAGRGSTPQRPVQLSVQLHPYGDGRLLLLSRDVTALAQAEAMRRDFRGECFARDPHTSDGPERLHRDFAKPGARPDRA
jgi:two-component system phosphate regulon sensor histidine kinase PhoR